MGDRRADNYWERLQANRVRRRRILAGGATFVTGGIALGLVGCGSSNNNSSKATTNNSATQAAVVPSKAATAAANPATTASTVAAGSPTRAPGSPAAVSTAAGAASPAAGANALKQPPAAGNFKTGGTIQVITVGAHPLDPVANTTYRAQWSAGMHYSRLFRFNSGPDPKTNLAREPIGDLVQAYEVTADGLQYTMHLRQGVMFHPPLSRPFTSADVKASWDYFTTSTKNANKDVYAPIVDSFTQPDNNTLVFKLKQPSASFINKLANTQYLWIMSQDAATQKIDPEQQAPGTGAWIYVNQTPTAVTWKKNPDYYIKGVPYADGLVLNIIADASTQEAQFAAGKIDYFGPPPADLEALQKQVPKATLIEYVPDGLSFFWFNSVADKASPFNDVRMRQAASLAIDRQALIDSLYNGRGVWENIINAGLGKWHLDPQGKDIGDGGKYFKKDPAMAKQLIAAAGQSNTEIRFIYPNNAYGDVYNATADAIRGMLSDAGFKIQVVTVDYLKDWINNGQGLFNKGAPANMPTIGFALQTPFTDPDDFLTGMFTKAGNRNHDLLDDVTTDPNFLGLIKKQATELDPDKRLQIVQDAQRAHASLMYLPPLIYTKVYLMANPWAQNLWVSDDYYWGAQQAAYLSVNNR